MTAVMFFLTEVLSGLGNSVGRLANGATSDRLRSASEFTCLILSLVELQSRFGDKLLII